MGKLFIDMMMMGLECIQGTRTSIGQRHRGSHHIPLHIFIQHLDRIESHYTTLRSAKRSQLGLVTYSTATYSNNIQHSKQASQHERRRLLNLHTRFRGQSKHYGFIFRLFSDSSYPLLHRWLRRFSGI